MFVGLFQAWQVSPGHGPLFFMPRKVAHKVSDHSDAARVVLWRKWAFHIAFYIFNFLEEILFSNRVYNTLS
jgi:hypothetical protein